MRKVIAICAIILHTLTFTSKPGAQTATSPMKVRQAINLAWCGNVKKICSTGNEAWKVSWCESRHDMYARNGQYLGLFQMGTFARSKYGHAWNVWVQAKAAHKYYLDAGGWGPWSCKPW